jgi:RNA polymerase sigma-70 factor, ECF subfamily
MPTVAEILIDTESREWLDSLRREDPDAIARLRELLVRAARFEVARRRPSLPHLRGGELADIAEEAANDATLSVLRRLDDYRGASRFTTWAYKFALLEAAVKIRRRAWQGRELPMEPESWTLVPGPEHDAEQAELLAAIRDGIENALTPHQREVLVALALNGVPIDVLAERTGTTRGALYKVLHDARRKLRAHVEEVTG